MAGFIAQDQLLSEQARLLNAAPGIGPTVLATLLGELPELGTLCRRKIAKPGTLAPYRLDATAIADLTDGQGRAADERIARAMAAPWKAIAGIEGGLPPSWALAQELIASGAEGALVPSAQNPGGTALILWRWHRADEMGADESREGAALELLDPDHVLTPHP
ncbi:RES family NAD+ phosphorylase [Sphingomonas sp. SORGH_AS_0870]|uniref:RES family NAD+ phosphorylase n=1 Tax=Sphingomonas sp. SORGH_AS_0870 TaxID=3041801 RepID=UPI00286C5D73|nr:RES family NAD+ phosphorylase [Sphingomonas sp. SORGH_AS_0870]